MSNPTRLIIFLFLTALLVLPTSATSALPLAYPPDPTADIAWNAGYNGAADVQAAFNYARTQENAQLGLSLPMLTLPSSWGALSDSERALWLINTERVDRGVAPLHGVEVNVTGVAQYYADYLLDNDTWGHVADGNDPWERLDTNPAIQACHDFLNVAENLSVFVTSGTSIPLPIERSIYNWMYDDAGSSWGHRHAIVWYPYNDNSGTVGQEGFLGIGRANGGPYQGPFSQPWNFAELVVINVFDPCSSWQYASTTDNLLYLPLVLRDYSGASTTYTISGNVVDNLGAPLAGVTLSDGTGHSTQTGTSGDYSLTSLTAGTYTVVPTLANYTFAPTSLTVSMPPDATTQNFVGTTTTPVDQRLVLFESFLRYT